MNYFLTSDTHFGHANSLRWRGWKFSSLEEHDEILMENWNKTVSEKDWVVFLGDFAFNTKEKGLEWYKRRLNGHIVFIPGNHDKTSSHYYLKNGKYGFEYSKKHLFERYYPAEFAQFKINGEKFCFCHYPLMTWPAKYHGRKLFFGHIHSGPNSISIEKDILPDNAWDVGVDNNDFRPISLEDAIIKIETLNPLKYYHVGSSFSD